MPKTRKLDQATLLDLKAEGLTAAQIQDRLTNDGTVVSIDLVRKRLSEARRETLGQPASPPQQRKSSATARRQGQLAEAVNLVEALQSDIQGVLDGWAANFAGSERYQRFEAAAEALAAVAEELEAVDVSW